MNTNSLHFQPPPSASQSRTPSKALRIMPEIVTVKWTSLQGFIYRSKIELEHVFPKEENINACALTSMVVSEDSYDGPIAVEVRLPGQKDYAPLSPLHLPATRTAGRARLRFMTIETSIPESRDTDTIQAFMNAASGARKINQAGIPVQAQPAPVEPMNLSTDSRAQRPSWASNLVSREEVSSIISTKINELIAAKMNVIISTIEEKASKTQQDFDLCGSCWDNARRSHSTHRFVKINDNSIIAAKTAKAVKIHAGILCDGPLCTKKKSPIVGDRYRCAICPDYDLCAGCEALPNSEHNITHPMIKMKVPVDRISVEVQHEANFGAKSPQEVVIGPMTILERASQAREQLLAQQAMEAQHAATSASNEIRDAMMKVGANIRRAMVTAEDSLRPVKHLTIACDGCDEMIQGPRFMCATCDDFDLCQGCYTNHSHPAEHVFIRYNHFVNAMTNPRLHFEAVDSTAPYMRFQCTLCKKVDPTGKRYTCMSCPSFTRCESCQSENVSKHPIDHPLKITPRATRGPGAKSSPVIANTVGEPAKLEKNDLTLAMPTPKVPEPVVYSAEYVEDISIPDGTVVRAGSSFVKQWLLKNDGESTWPAGIKAVFVGGLEMQTRHYLKAPQEAKNNIISYWKLVCPAGERFGCKLWVDIDVEAEKSPQGCSNTASFVSATSSARMIFPEASTELARPGPFSNDTVSVASQRATEGIDSLASEDEIVLSSDDDYDVLDNESFSDDN
ncbi:hypothetical protein MRB53_039800 [Persea americana]|nr:hypothetical protein MRB53_039800 [Persea americana]